MDRVSLAEIAGMTDRQIYDLYGHEREEDGRIKQGGGARNEMGEFMALASAFGLAAEARKKVHEDLAKEKEAGG